MEKPTVEKEVRPVSLLGNKSVLPDIGNDTGVLSGVAGCRVPDGQVQIALGDVCLADHTVRPER